MKQNKRKSKTTNLFKAIRQSLRKRRSYNSEKTSLRFYPRHLARSIAKANMKRAGAVHINSIFSYYWRDFVMTR